MNIKEAYDKKRTEDERRSADYPIRVSEGPEGLNASEVVPARAEAGGPCCKSQETHDSVGRPLHYASGAIECIDAIQVATSHLSGFEGMLTGNCLKYLWRWKLKNGLEDLKKSRWYLNKLISTLEISHGSADTPKGY